RWWRDLLPRSERAAQSAARTPTAWPRARRSWRILPYARPIRAGAVLFHETRHRGDVGGADRLPDRRDEARWAGELAEAEPEEGWHVLARRRQLAAQGRRHVERARRAHHEADHPEDRGVERVVEGRDPRGAAID